MCIVLVTKIPAYSRSAGVKYKDQNKHKIVTVLLQSKVSSVKYCEMFCSPAFFLNSQSHQVLSFHLLHSTTALILYHLPELSFFLLDGFFSESLVGFAGASSSSSAATLTRLGLLPSDSPEAKASPGFIPLLASVAARCQSECWNEGCCSTRARSCCGKLWGAVTRQEAEKSE